MLSEESFSQRRKGRKEIEGDIYIFFALRSWRLCEKLFFII